MLANSVRRAGLSPVASKYAAISHQASSTLVARVPATGGVLSGNAPGKFAAPGRQPSASADMQSKKVPTARVPMSRRELRSSAPILTAAQDHAPDHNPASVRTVLLRRHAEILGRQRAPVAERVSEPVEQSQIIARNEAQALQLRRDRMTLVEIDAALDRLERGEYGTCIDCEEGIAPRRLAAIPWAARCVPCQEATEARRDLDEEPEVFGKYAPVVGAEE